MQLDSGEQSGKIVIEAQHITKSFGATQALRGVSLQVNRGEVLALIGENGAGKSTLMKVLSGAHAPDAGSMRSSGRPRSQHARARTEAAIRCVVPLGKGEPFPARHALRLAASVPAEWVNISGGVH